MVAPTTPLDEPGSADIGAVGRHWTIPERLSLALLGVGVGGLGLQRATGSMGIGLLCPLRAVTGIPCPLCGMTTSASALAELRLAGAVVANPIFPVLVVLAAAVLVVALVRRVGLLKRARPWPPAAVHRMLATSAAVASASWAWQLHRFGWI